MRTGSQYSFLFFFWQLIIDFYFFYSETHRFCKRSICATTSKRCQSARRDAQAMCAQCVCVCVCVMPMNRAFSCGRERPLARRAAFARSIQEPPPFQNRCVSNKSKKNKIKYLHLYPHCCGRIATPFVTSNTHFVTSENSYLVDSKRPRRWFKTRGDFFFLFFFFSTPFSSFVWNSLHVWPRHGCQFGINSFVVEEKEKKKKKSDCVCSHLLVWITSFESVAQCFWIVR